MTKEFANQVKEENRLIEDALKRDGHEIVLLGLGGSHAYGTNVEGSDIDVRGMYSNTADELLGLTSDREQYTSNEPDTTIYSVRKAARLLKECNPSTLEILYCRPEDYVYVSPAGRLLIDNASCFVSKRAVEKFGGYAKGQLNRLVNRSGRAKELIIENEARSFSKDFLTLQSRYKQYIPGSADVKEDGEHVYLSFSVKDMPADKVASILNEFNSIDRNYRKSVRNDKATTHDKLSKHMMHLIRLYMTGIELLNEGTMRTYRDGSEHSLLMSIRNGDYLKEDKMTPTDEFEQLVAYYTAKYEEAAENTKLPDEPDMKKINDLLITINKMYI